MATVTGYTAERMKQIEDSSMVSCAVVGNNLIVTRFNATQINAGNCRGPQGIQGPMGITSVAVCTSTTRPTGGSLFTGLGIYETDTKRFYIYDGSAWIYRGGLWLCTSITRPASPFEGLQIYENDTNKYYIYDGATWNLPANVAGGELGYAEITTPKPSGIVATMIDLAALTITVTVLANRKIKISAHIPAVFSTIQYDILGVYIREGSTTLQEVDITSGSAISADTGGTAIARLSAPTAGSHTYKVSVARVSGTGGMSIETTATRKAFIMVEDIGGV